MNELAVDLSGEARQSLRVNPFVVVDVGAAGGVHERYANDFVRVIGFEPDDTGFEQARAAAPPNLILLPDALWSETATKQLFITRSRRCTSLYSAEPRLHQRVPRQAV